MNNNLTKIKDKRRMGIECDLADPSEDGDFIRPDDPVDQPINPEINDIENNEIDFDSYKIDAMKSDREF
jgi:hypothetical protein